MWRFFDDLMMWVIVICFPILFVFLTLIAVGLTIYGIVEFIDFLSKK